MNTITWTASCTLTGSRAETILKSRQVRLAPKKLLRRSLLISQSACEIFDNLRKCPRETAHPEPADMGKVYFSIKSGTIIVWISDVSRDMGLAYPLSRR